MWLLIFLVLLVSEVIMFSFKFDCVTLVFSSYDDCIRALDYWLVANGVGELYNYLAYKGINYEFA